MKTLLLENPTKVYTIGVNDSITRTAKFYYLLSKNNYQPIATSEYNDTESDYLPEYADELTIVPFKKVIEYNDMNKHWWRIKIIPILIKIDKHTKYIDCTLELEDMLEDGICDKSLLDDERLKKQIELFNNYCEEFDVNYTTNQKNEVFTTIRKITLNLIQEFQQITNHLIQQ